jgi:hypothetical protein
VSRFRGFGDVFMQLAEERPVAYYPKLVKVAGSVNAAIFLSQLGYWTPKASDPDGWVYKTQVEWELETGLTRWEQETARRQLRERSILTEVKKGMPARLYFRIDVDALTVTWEEAFSARDEEIPQPRMRRSHNQSTLEAGSGFVSARDSYNQQAAQPTGKDVVPPQANSKEAGTTSGTTSTNSGGGGADLDLETLKVQLIAEFENRDLDEDLLEPTLEELRLTTATGTVRYPLRYCLRTATNLQAQRDASLRTEDSQQLHLEWRRNDLETCPHGKQWDNCQACREDAAKGARLKRRSGGEAVA